jgi:hypothetical protein
MARSAGLWNRLAKRYAATPVKHEADYRTKLEGMLTRAGFRTDYEWRPAKNPAALIVAKKWVVDAERPKASSLRPCMICYARRRQSA